MNGKQFFEAMERSSSGFLRRAYGERAYTDDNDAQVASELAGSAKGFGVGTLTGHMVQEARRALGMKARSMAAVKPRESPAAPIAAPHPPAQPELFPTAGERRIAEALEKIAEAQREQSKALWALRDAVAKLHGANAPSEAQA